MQNFINSMSDDLMNSLVLIRYVVADDCPDYVMHLLSRKFIKNADRASEYIIKLFTTIFGKVDFRVTNDNIWVASKLRLLCFKVTKCSTNRQSARENSIWTNERIVHSVLISGWLFNSDLLETWLSLVVYHGVGLVNMPPCSFNSSEL